MIYVSKRINSAKMPGNEYYSYLKKALKPITGLVAGCWEDVSTRSNDYAEGRIVIRLVRYKIPGGDWSKATASVIKQADAIKQVFGADTQVRMGDQDRPLVSVSIDDLTAAMGGQVAAKPAATTISFWVTTAGDSRNTAYAYGAKITDPDGFKFPTSMKRIQDNIGSKRFHYYVAGITKSFKTHKAMKEFFAKEGVGHIAGEEEVIEAGWEEKYFTC